MRIQDGNLTGAAGPQTSRVQGSQNKASASFRSSAEGGTEDRVEFSAGLGALARAMSADQASRASRIQSLAVQVRGGAYRPDAQAISRRMVTDALAGSGSGG
jgi:hypothetical protein